MSLHVQQMEGRISQLGRRYKRHTDGNTRRHMKSTSMLHGQVGGIECRPHGAASAGQDVCVYRHDKIVREELKVVGASALPEMSLR